MTLTTQHEQREHANKGGAPHESAPEPSPEPSMALVTTDKIAETVALRDASLAAFESAAATIQAGYLKATEADALADRAALGFRDDDDERRRQRREARKYDPAKEVAEFRLGNYILDSRSALG